MVTFLVWYLSCIVVLLIIIWLSKREERKYLYYASDAKSEFEGFPYYLIFIPLINFLLIFFWGCCYIAFRKDCKRSIDEKLKRLLFDNMVHLL